MSAKPNIDDGMLRIKNCSHLKIEIKRIFFSSGKLIHNIFIKTNKKNL